MWSPRRRVCCWVGARPTIRRRSPPSRPAPAGPTAPSRMRREPSLPRSPRATAAPPPREQHLTMASEARYRRMDAARVRAELTVQDLWLRYLALGGTGDAFDLDGYLQGLVPLDDFQQDIFAQALNDALR